MFSYSFPVEQDLVVPEVQRYPKRSAPDRRQERPQRRGVSADGMWQGETLRNPHRISVLFIVAGDSKQR